MHAQTNVTSSNRGSLLGFWAMSRAAARNPGVSYYTRSLAALYDVRLEISGVVLKGFSWGYVKMLIA